MSSSQQENVAGDSFEGNEQAVKWRHKKNLLDLPAEMLREIAEQVRESFRFDSLMLTDSH